MKVVSTNIAKPTTIEWNGEKLETGIYKTPVSSSIYLGKNDVNNDSVIDRKDHGGEHKACYFYSASHYAHFKELYPNLDWKFGMFGENITIDNFEETNIRIGDTFKIGSAIIQVSEPRQPCFKLGLRFKNQKILKDFIQSSYSGFYVRIIEEGEVKNGDNLTLIERNPNDISVEDVFSLLSYNKDNELLKQAIKEESLLSEKYRNSI
ncbi:MOSC domain-containing protein [Vicingus serpentipes]|uniref:MOSC domain-containing protein n=1 Tax=Vicingus serpentipes TaxID=1926625 RepID=A0A5C6RUB5_9FLAO|nr:MOSC domain-containing protein [Vicingus serpentipes]TXB66076.1 MOSC domain-containing protein [Vicingus serpentipes]